MQNARGKQKRVICLLQFCYTLGCYTTKPQLADVLPGHRETELDRGFLVALAYPTAIIYTAIPCFISNKRSLSKYKRPQLYLHVFYANS